MKNAINYFYNIIVNDIYQNEFFYYFDYDNEHYVLIAYLGDPSLLNELYDLHLTLLKNGVYVHQIILNAEHNIATIINGTPYILMKARYYSGKISFNNILAFSYLPNIFNLPLSHNTKNKNVKKSLLERVNIGDLWSSKNDYLEYQLSQLGHKHQLLRDSFDYYIGLAEAAICLANDIPQNMLKTVCHRRIKSNDTVFDFYNPLNLIIDGRERDICEYLKMRFFDGFDINSDVNIYFNSVSLSRNDYLMFFARMLYPTYYFDLFEQIISGKKKDEEIKKITNLSSNYETFLRNIYKYYRRSFNIEPIEWLE